MYVYSGVKSSHWASEYEKVLAHKQNLLVCIFFYINIDHVENKQKLHKK